ncbi:MAG TPA: response regulator [Melioribacteraceae bacterium]|nr:response regulator [Melioribacteraceae bacterium]
MKKNNLLIVDDDEKLRFNLQLYFEDEGYNCTPFECAEDALLSLNNCKYDAAIVDLRLPGINGEEFIIKAYTIIPEMQCILYTGSSDFKLTEKLKEINFNKEDIFLKPIEDMRVLLKRIEEKMKL